MSKTNVGATWSKEMDDELIALLKSGAALSDIASKMGRGAGGILARMEYLNATLVRFSELRLSILRGVGDGNT